MAKINVGDTVRVIAKSTAMVGIPIGEICKITDDDGDGELNFEITSKYTWGYGDTRHIELVRRGE